MNEEQEKTQGETPETLAENLPAQEPAKKPEAKKKTAKKKTTKKSASAEKIIEDVSNPPRPDKKFVEEGDLLIPVEEK